MDSLNAISTILESGQKTNSYKYALTLALTDAKEEFISARWLAERFLVYYWPLSTCYRIRQSTDPMREPVAFKWSASLHKALSLDPGTSLAHARKEHPAKIDDLVSRLSLGGGCLDEVLPRYHTVRHQQVQPPIYSMVGKDIRIDPNFLQRMRTDRLPFRQLAIGQWVRFCERVSSSPKLFAKLSGATPRRSSLHRYRPLLASIDGNACFYCGAAATGSSHIDHFLPWSFVFEDRLWNLVIACGGGRGCNSAKSDRIPPAALVGKLIARGRDLLDGKFGHEVQGHPDLREWAVWDLDKHIEQLASTALAEGFSEWGLDLR